MVRHVESFDREALEPESGVRALWLLYERGQWGSLQDFGVERHEVESTLDKFRAEQAVTSRLTKAQCRRIVELIPILGEAATELQLSYALKFMVRGEAVMMRSWYTEPMPEMEAALRSSAMATPVNRVGGDLTFTRIPVGFAVIMLDLPDGVTPTSMGITTEFKMGQSALMPVDKDVGDGDSDDAVHAE